MKSARKVLPPLLALVFLGVIGLEALRVPRTPAVVAAHADPEVFSAERASKTIEVIAAEAHPPGTKAHDAVRRYLIARLEEMGLDPEIQKAVSVSPRATGTIVGSRVRNIVARRSGSGDGKAILVLAHYDSRPGTPGAADDASGVAVALECLRALADETLANDLIVLLSDGEELGLLGARAFAERHPWFEDVALVINLEARGNTGPAMMFETAPENGRLIRWLARYAPWPVADSFSDEVYSRMPNSSDFTIFRERGIPGLNFAFIGGIESYHTALDTPARLDLNSVQHLGGNLLGLLRAIGNESLDLVEAPDAVYFNPWGGERLVVYPAVWGRALGLALFAALVFVIALGRGKGRLDLGDVLHGAIATVLACIFAPVVAWAAWRLLEAGWPQLAAGPHGLPYAPRALGLGIFLLVVAVVAGFARWTWDRSGTPGSLSGVLLVWVTLGLLAGFLVPGGSHLLQIPVLLALLPAAWLIIGRPKAWLGLLLSICVAAPVLILLLPFVDSLHVAMTLQRLEPAALFAALACSICTPLLGRLPAPVGSGATGVLGAACLIVLATTAPQDSDHPVSNDLAYLLDADRGEAIWLSRDDSPDAWTRRVLGNEPEIGSWPSYLGGPTATLNKKAEALPLLAPTVEVIEDLEDGKVRRLRLRVLSRRGAPVLRVAFEGESKWAVRAVERQELKREWTAADDSSIFFLASDAQGIEIEVEHLGSDPIRIHVTDQSWPLPASGPGERPPGYLASSLWSTDATFVHRSISL